MKKILLCEGDSWTSGDMINPDINTTYVNHSDNDSYRLPKVWPHKLGKMLDVDVLNFSEAGSSNDSIIRRLVPSVFELLKKYKGDDIFVIVGWTSPERKDFFTENNWETLYPAHNHRQGVESVNKLWDVYVKYFWNEEEYISRYIHTNLYIHYFLKSHNIEHMFFDAFYETTEFGINHDLQIRNIIDDKEYLKVTDEFTKNTSFKNFLLRQNEQDLFNDDDPHPSEKGHQLWAEELSKDLQWIK